MVNERLLCRGHMGGNYLSQSLSMNLNLLFAWCDAGFKPQQFPVRGFPGLVFTNSVLTYIETKEVKPWFLCLMPDEGMSQSGFARIQFQSYAIKPIGN
jgi:hypothetical protein